MSGLAGCPALQQTRRFEAIPARLAPEAANLGYALVDSSTSEVTQSVEASEASLEVTLVSHLASYQRSGVGFVDDSAVGIASTPDAEVATVAVNPLANRSIVELITGDVGREFLQQLGIDADWERGPEQVGGGTGTLFGTLVEFDTYAGITDTQEFALLSVVRATDGDDAVLVGDARTTTDFDQDANFVGTNGAISQLDVDQCVALFADLLPLIVHEPPGERETVGPTRDGNDGEVIVGRESADPANRIHAVQLEGASVQSHEISTIPQSAFSEADLDLDEDDRPPTTKEFIHPTLREWIQTRPPNQRERLVVTFKDDVDIPRFPEPAANEPRNSQTNRQLLARSEELIDTLRARRENEYDRIEALLREREGEVIETFWLVKAVHVDLALEHVTDLAVRDDVQYIEPDEAGEVPPSKQSDGLADSSYPLSLDDWAALQAEVDNARALIDSDPYFALGLTGGWIGLMDTGVRRTHDVFSSPTNLAYWRDCINGTSGNCSAPSADQNPDDDGWNHGTSSAAIISGNDALGGEFRGVTDVALDSFKVYPGRKGLSGAATIRAFEAGIAVLDRVLVAEMQSGGSATGSVSTAADNAFDAGAVVIAANGNNGPDEKTVNAPANAHRAIGIGGFDVESGNQYNGQSRGPTGDGRIKPDVQAPTNSETASASSDSATKDFSGTSGATPYGAGAATLLRNWLRNGFSIDPGQVYAQLILSGQEEYRFDNTSGAGPLQLPTGGHAWWGKVSLRHGQQVDVPISMSSGRTLDGALWWPEEADDPHSHVGLALVDPSGMTRATSTSLGGVFQRARVEGSIEGGEWKLAMSHFNFGFRGTRTVYFAAHRKRA